MGNPVAVGIAVVVAVLLVGLLAWLAVTAPARLARRRHVEMLIRSAEAQVTHGQRADGSPIWPCGPHPVNAQETGYCELAPGHDGDHGGLISSPAGTRRGVWPHYNPQPWREEPRA